MQSHLQPVAIVVSGYSSGRASPRQARGLSHRAPHPASQARPPPPPPAGGVARKYGAPFEVESCKAKFFEIYLEKYAVAGAGIGYTGARELVGACRAAGLRVAVASSADLVKASHAAMWCGALGCDWLWCDGMCCDAAVHCVALSCIAALSCAELH